MEVLDVQIYLRRCGVVVHHAARMPPASDGRQSMVVFLEAGLGQFELARECVLRLPGVIGVTFSGYSRSIMYITSAEPGGRAAGLTQHPDSPPPEVRRKQLIQAGRSPEPGRSRATERRRASG